MFIYIYIYNISIKCKYFLFVFNMLKEIKSEEKIPKEICKK